MAKCDLRIELDGERTRYRAGETVRGTVVVSTRGEVRCDGLEVALEWRTGGRGNRVDGGPAPVKLFEGTWSGGEHRYRVELELPDGPLSYQGELLRVEWLVRARAEVPLRIDPKAEVEIELLPDPDLDTDWRAQFRLSHFPSRVYKPIPDEPRITAVTLIHTETGEDPEEGAAAWTDPWKTPVGKGCLTLFTILLVGLGIWAGLQVPEAVEIWQSGNWMEAVETLFYPAAYFAFLVGLLVVWVRWWMVKDRLKRVEVEIANPRVERGDSLRIGISCVSRKSTTIRRTTATLRAREKVASGSVDADRSRPRSRQRKAWEEEVFEREVEIGPRHELSRGIPYRVEAAVPVPSEVPPTFVAIDNEVTWILELTLHLADWPDWSQKREIVVVP